MKMFAFMIPLVSFAIASSVDAQERYPQRYLLTGQPHVVVHRTPVVTPVVPPHRVRVVVHHRSTPVEPVEPVEPPAERPPASSPRWFVGVGTGALLRFGDQNGATPSYRIHAGVIVNQAEFVFRFDLAPGFEVGDPAAGTADAALYTAGAGFHYRFFKNSVVHPVVGIGLETVFFNPEGAETSRAFGLTARLGAEMGFATRFGEVALGLDATGHQPLAGAQEAMARLLGIGAHLDFRF